MAELYLIRHGQASFGADNYDCLSETGHAQSAAVGVWLRSTGWEPDRLMTGTLERQRDTLSAMGYGLAPEEHAGFNEYDFHDLLLARYQGKIPDVVRGDRKTHFRTLRDTVLEWQAGGLPDATESYRDFCERTAAAMQHATRDGARRVLVVSSGGVIGQLVSQALEAPARMMMELNLQIKNTGVTKFVFSGSRHFVHQFNATPHFDTVHELLTYS
ncbi:histidine phosphatase family protein [Pseudosulfitobacter koreensis]|uniref:Histidine phosphatase family protein n=1 Tax=Pseudosulfitobacter koreensis TaxID=2968472 RepID=A0ABT1Z0A5_9RHOB|nr:histidine phosphatase family protein [Pseudosulfitobacter koreense]MCR8826558.1 histidine phosphatase family protein [Pseudosulfitobacter koreense]